MSEKLDKIVDEQSEVLKELNKYRTKRLAKRRFWILFFILAVATGSAIIYYYPAFTFFAGIGTLLSLILLLIVLFKNFAKEDYELYADTVLLKHIWKKCFGLRSPKNQEYESGRLYEDIGIIETLLFPALVGNTEMYYKLRSFYGGRISKTNFESQNMKYGIRESDRYGKSSIKSVIGDFYVFQFTNPEWKLEKSFIVPSKLRDFHRKELYAYQKEVKFKSDIISTSKYRMYTNNEYYIDQYVKIFERYKQFQPLQNTNEVRISFNKSTIAFAFPKDKNPLFSARIHQNPLRKKELKRIHDLLHSIIEITKEVNEIAGDFGASTQSNISKSN
ncbi:hypothetical protein K6119_09585 [Paracrocinitomix mangrovi]|uniref:hypothetical protein n=1 Tax=Paracrocinitomix mangrovi TaxID=2862509 RepID=UPI001C8F13CB|nr:hypothetical protein [Paracrocinitomix mangrovi]UKN03742.1 hypothetical protein K6119_09585 [Paracrocinitomix mangrovi]